MAIFSSAFFPPISYFLSLLEHKTQIEIEQHEHFVKQSYRNRCRLVGSNGLIQLTAPVQKKSKTKTKIKDIELNYDENWRDQHLRSMTAAYQSSAFYQYIKSDIEHIYSKKHRFLFDFNQEIFQFLIQKMKLDLSFQLTETYQSNLDLSNDFRMQIHPKKDTLAHLNLKPYFQVFNERQAFIPDLSALDLLCNLGQDSERYLLSCLSSETKTLTRFPFPKA